MGFRHGLGDCGIPRLVRADQAEHAESTEQTHVEDSENEKNRPGRNLNGAFFNSARANWSDGIQAGKSSIRGKSFQQRTGKDKSSCFGAGFYRAGFPWGAQPL